MPVQFLKNYIEKLKKEEAKPKKKQTKKAEVDEYFENLRNRKAVYRGVMKGYVDKLKAKEAKEAEEIKKAEKSEKVDEAEEAKEAEEIKKAEKSEKVDEAEESKEVEEVKSTKVDKVAKNIGKGINTEDKTVEVSDNNVSDKDVEKSSKKTKVTTAKKSGKK